MKNTRAHTCATPHDFLNCNSKRYSQRAETYGNSSSLYLPFLDSHSLYRELYPNLYCCCLVLRKSLSVRQRQNRRLQTRAMVKPHSCHLMGRHLSHGRHVSSGPQTPTGLSKQSGEHKWVCTCVFVGTCSCSDISHWCGDRLTEAVSDFVWILFVCVKTLCCFSKYEWWE